MMRDIFLSRMSISVGIPAPQGSAHPKYKLGIGWLNLSTVSSGQSSICGVNPYWTPDEAINYVPSISFTPYSA